MTEMVKIKIDGTEVEVEKGTLIIRAAEQVGIHIPRFCDHPLLKPVGACRQCLVDVAMPDREGVVRPMPKPQASCTMTVAPGMEVATQLTSATAQRAQEGVMEFLLINHPLDCPVCDKGGECPLQNQALSNGRATSRFQDAKRTYPKPLAVSTQILLDRDRCILCQRCVRFSKEIAGDAFIDLQGRGAKEQIGGFDAAVLGFADAGAPTLDQYAGPGGQAGLVGGMHPGPVGAAELDESGRPFASYFSGNTVQICPVGALTSAAYRFRSRPFDLLSLDSITEHDASGAAIRVDVRRGTVLRRLAGEDAEVNEEWITDKDRFAFTWQSLPDRLDTPLVRDENGALVPTSWADALDVAAQLLAEARGSTGFLPGGRLPLEDAYAWSRFARMVAATNDIDARVRSASDEELSFLAAHVAGRRGVTYAELERAGQVLLVGFEPEDECGTVFLRLRKGVLAGTARVATLAPLTTAGSSKLRATRLAAAPGAEPEVVAGIAADGPQAQLAADLAGGVIVVGERAAAVPGLLSAVVALAERTGARLAWIPRRVGERAAVEVGALPGLLPGGRPLAAPAARRELEAHWGGSLPTTPGRDAAAMWAAAAAGELTALVIGGVDVRDCPDVATARRALATARIISLEVRPSEVTEYAEVVLPVAPPVEKGGTYLNWEGRRRPFGQVLTSRALPDREVLHRLAAECGVDLGLGSLAAAVADLEALAPWSAPVEFTARAAGPLSVPAAGQALLATHKPLLDKGRCQDGEPYLAGTARRSVALLGAATAAELGVEAGQELQVSGPAGTITLPLALADLPARVVWLPQCSAGSDVHGTLGVSAGAVVQLSAKANR
ncbi:NADH-quinone oxidoreductase subunit G [Buchananella hordeovulneris]|uniref:NADH-quinone oxidoreductase subunit G n=1 Tax=Buchananella hordeovulneris TaxID=52770 RepID=UPI000F5F2043|nr:NADH-quinone oxidoreductase subunit G [Buchananella hordeovulneris]MDO5081025.1 NADH-quinone oxidoreductase subunit G [Buchananella hordeovulneris]RRD43769.1 NADH-quinone oxidoreductase subunit G [Buchananella hordeovulneris]